MNMSAKKQTSTNRFIPNKAAGTQFGESASWTCFAVLQMIDILCIALHMHINGNFDESGAQAMWTYGWSTTVQASLQNTATVISN